MNCTVAFQISRDIDEQLDKFTGNGIGWTGKWCCNASRVKKMSYCVLHDGHNVLAEGVIVSVSTFEKRVVVEVNHAFRCKRPWTRGSRQNPVSYF